MVPVLFIEDLAEELSAVLAHMRLPSPLGGESGVNIFRYGLPIEKTREDSKKKFPYVLVIPQDGSLGKPAEPQKASVQLLVGVYDSAAENQGKKVVLNIINDICGRFLEDPILGGRYYADEEIKWVVDMEEEHPFHYGAIWMAFNIPAARRESVYA